MDCCCEIRDFTLGLLSQTGAPDEGGGGGGGVDGHGERGGGDGQSLKLLLLQAAADFGLVKRSSCEESPLCVCPFLMGLSEPSCIVIAPGFPGKDGAGYGGAGQGGQGAGQGGQEAGQGGQGVEHGGQGGQGVGQGGAEAS